MTVRVASTALIGVAALWLVPMSSACAGLGRPLKSVEEDRAALRAQRTSTYHDTYTVHELALPNGGAVKEFTRTDGAVFAVTWNAPGRPDLRQLLGASFNTMQDENAPQAGRRLRRPLAVNHSGLLLQSGGHPGAFWGVAVAPALQPAGFGPSDLK